MNGQPLVSIIINCYNSEKYLRDTIESVLAQTYSNYEVIFWDNCSTDLTADIIHGYNDTRFRYFVADTHTPLGKARNLAIKQTKGVFICFLDSDDIWRPEFLESAVNALLVRDQSCIGYYCNYNNWKDDKRVENNQGRPAGVHDQKFILHHYGIGMSGCVMRSSIINDNSVLFDCDFQLVEDMDFFLSILEFGSFVYDPRPMYDYRITSDNTSRKHRDEWASEYHHLYVKLYNKYVNTDPPILLPDDLERIRYFEILYQLENYISKNDRSKALLYMFRTPSLPSRFWSRLIFVLMGKNLYNRIRNL